MLDSTWGAERFIIAHTDGMMKPWWRIEIAAWTAHSGVPALRIAAFVCSVEAGAVLPSLGSPTGTRLGALAIPSARSNWLEAVEAAFCRARFSAAVIGFWPAGTAEEGRRPCCLAYWSFQATLLDLLARHRVIARPDLERRGGQRALLGAVQGLLASGLLAGGGGIG
jgi:hypothetical protein